MDLRFFTPYSLIQIQFFSKYIGCKDVEDYREDDVEYDAHQYAAVQDVAYSCKVIRRGVGGDQGKRSGAFYELQNNVDDKVYCHRPYNPVLAEQVAGSDGRIKHQRLGNQGYNSHQNQQNPGNTNLHIKLVK